MTPRSPFTHSETTGTIVRDQVSENEGGQRMGDTLESGQHILVTVDSFL